MPINQDTHYVIKNGIVEQPAIVKDGLELYYDAKGKHNNDVHKDTLLDLSGNNRHGTLVNFAYEGVSGYQENGIGGILLDDVDDKIVRPAISGIEYTSASRNLFNSVQSEWESGTFGTLTTNVANVTRIRQINTYIVEPNVPHTISCATGYLVNVNVNGTGLNFAQSVSFTSTNGEAVRFVIKRTDDAPIAVSELTASKFQLEKGSVATPYTPYIPLPVMTYQMNGNILSFEKDGTVKRTTKDANGNEVVVSRKGINLVRNSNFYNETNRWSVNGLCILSVNDSILKAKNPTTNYGRLLFGINDILTSLPMASKVYFSTNIRANKVGNIKIQLTENGVASGVAISSTIVGQTNFTKHELILTGNSGIGTVYKHLTFDAEDYKNFDDWVEVKDCQLINLTEAYGAGNEPTLEYIQSHPEEFAWTPNPNDLIETVEIKNNLVGDLENLQGNDFEQHEDGVITYTNEAEEGSVVRVDIDGVSFQDVGSGKNIFYKNELYSKYSDINDDCLNISIGDRFFYQIDGAPNAQYTTSFYYKRDNATAPVSISFYYTDGTSDENPQLMSSSDRVRLTLSSAIGKTVSGVGYNPPVVLGCSWKKISNPTMERTGLALSLAQEDESLGVRWNKLQNPIMERV